MDDGRGVTGILLEDQYFRMIVKGKGFFGGLVVDHQGTDGRIGFESGNQVKAQVTVEHARFCHTVAPDDILIRRAADQLAVVLGGQRIAFGQAGDLGILVVGGDEDVIGLVQHALEAGQFIGVIIPVDLQVQVTAIDAAKGIIGCGAKRQGIIVISFIGDRQHRPAPAPHRLFGSAGNR